MFMRKPPSNPLLPRYLIFLASSRNPGQGILARNNNYGEGGEGMGAKNAAANIDGERISCPPPRNVASAISAAATLAVRLPVKILTLSACVPAVK